MKALEEIDRRLEDPHDADTFGVVGGVLDVTPEGGVTAMLGFAPEGAHIRLVLHPDDVGRLVHTPLPDGRVALDILPEHHDGATVVVSPGCRHGTTGLYNALDNTLGDMEAIDDEMREASAGSDASA